ncbi:SPOC domain-like protein [Cristinia sonorae]|uniref:ATP-dependent DNA helicase II subunit 2 n=1 Tax=Cristinia sonorae TaxID=1940300 RepID=A0A8K0XR96_9AGAR|nr:SPOC domain-like protein [Cristinia sonorae]
MAERAGYTVTMFLIDVSPTMGETREVIVPDGPNGEERTLEMTNLEWSLQYIKLKIQEMIYNGRKTDQCGVILFGTEDTDNVINERDGGYEHVSEFIPIGQPNAGTLAKLSALQPSTEIGDPVDALIVAIETQDTYLAKKKTWTRKMILLTDGRNPVEIEDWEATAKKMNVLDISLTIVGVDFDDEEMPFEEEDKPEIKRVNEEFFHNFISKLDKGSIGNCQYALQEVSRPDVKQTKSALLGHELRIGDTETYPDEAIRLQVKASKCTALSRPKSWKRFARANPRDPDIIMRTQQDDDYGPKAIFSELTRRTEYYVDKKKDEDDEDEDMDGEKDAAAKVAADSEEVPTEAERVEKEELIRGFKYGASFVPCPDGNFNRLPTKKGIDICGFFPTENFKRDQAMGDVQYIWADPNSPANQVALSSIVKAMTEKKAMAIARWVSKDGMDPKMGVLYPIEFDSVDCFLWVQMPFADDVRKYTFASLDNLISKKGEKITNHPYIPTEEQQRAMDNFVDAMDLMDAGEKDEDGNRLPWFDTRLSYNPAIHRTKQAQFHGAVVEDLNTHPLPPPHWELLKYFEPPRRVLKRAHSALEECKQSFNVKQVPKKVVRPRKDGHVRAADDEEMLLLDQLPKPAKSSSQVARSQTLTASQSQRKSISPKSQKQKAKKAASDDSDTATEEEPDDDLPLSQKGPAVAAKVKPRDDEDVLMTPSPSVSSQIPTAVGPSQEADPGRVPGRIIGLTKPLDDFIRNTKTGDIVSKAVLDLGWAITEIVKRPFARRRTKEMLECMKKLREVAKVEDEVEAWNEFLQDLKHTCLEDEPGNQDFWTQVKKQGREMSLISKSEVKKKHGVSEDEAVEFIES